MFSSSAVNQNCSLFWPPVSSTLVACFQSVFCSTHGGNVGNVTVRTSFFFCFVLYDFFQA